MICYLVQAHHQPEHHRRLVETLTADGDVVLTHVDAKADQAAFTTGEGSAFTETRTAVSWRGFSQITATLTLLEEGRRRHPEATHYWFISGDSYPLRSPRRLREMVEEHPDRQWINLLPFPAPEMGKPESRLSGLWIEHDPRRRKVLSLALRLLFRTVRLPYRDALGGLRPLCGSQWFTLTAPAVDAVLEQARMRTSFRRLCRRTNCPDEHFFHTLLGATEYVARTAPAGMYADFESPSGPWPNVVTADHLRRLRDQDPGDVRERYGSGGYYFARKFTDENSELLTAAVRQQLWPQPILDAQRNPAVDRHLGLEQTSPTHSRA
ncbi:MULTISPECIES: beta-1,6-N-acetylglucosaminyltransferase [unclassified Curtobacterium]|uniref:beta-1,6-N-acetylglucosaminyltransferase n=1 Tax=unclassified Curtobacterium TaxID=257496 RepID=UPI002881515A|nr:beta-1,6-N-acetylglucosaminyltransferase [Curtobacterium sp. BRD11]MDT0209477.1 beta-1,6-N-acetylglucosaminyltransferase [Curtobacterium sp. BRD11]